MSSNIAYMLVVFMCFVYVVVSRLIEVLLQCVIFWVS